MGGMGAITQAMASAARNLAQKLKPILRSLKSMFAGGRLRGVILEDGTEFAVPHGAFQRRP